MPLNEVKVWKTSKTKTPTLRRIKNVNNVDEVVEKATKEARNAVYRDLSKQLGVNLFEEAERKAFVERYPNLVPKEAIDQEVGKMKTELETYKTQIEEYKVYKDKATQLELDNALIRKGVKDDVYDKAKKLVQIEIDGGLSHKEAVSKVVEEFPFFVKTVRSVGMDADNGASVKSANERILDKYKNDPRYARYTKK